MRTGHETRDGVLLIVLTGLLSLWLLWTPRPVEAGKGVGEDAAYAREMGFEQRFYFVTAGSDGENQIEYICKAFPGTIGSDATSSSVWQVQRFYYDSSDRLSRISFAGDDDSYSFSCDSRTSLDYD